MKKLLSIILLSISALSYADTARINYALGNFFADFNAAAENDYLTSGKIILIVDSKNQGQSGFENFTLNAGDSLVQGDFLNASQDYYVLGSFNIASSGMNEGLASGTFTFELDANVATDMNIAMVFIESADAPSKTIVSLGDNYGIYTPSFAPSGVDGKSGGDNWTVPSASADGTNIFFTTKSLDDSPTSIPNEMAVMNMTVVPEPSTYAAIFGALAFTFAVYRRKK